MSKPDVKLLMVTTDNHNKFYNLHDNDNGTCTVNYGRVGSDGTTRNYDISDWDKIISSKLKKGYKDISKNTQEVVGYVELSDKEADHLLKYFLDISRQYVAQYTDTTFLTPSAQDDAQAHINDLAKNISNNGTLVDFNKILLELFLIIPRKMKNVKDALCKSDSDRQMCITREQDLLNNIISMSKGRPTQGSNQTLPESFGFSFVKCSQAEEDFIKDKLQKDGSFQGRFSRAWKIANATRDQGFEEYLANNKLANNDKNIKLYWHGTDPQNVLSIMANGLGIGYAANGCYGRGIYNAPNITKSFGYCRYSYDDTHKNQVTYMFINAVIMGKAFEVHGTSTRYGAYSVGNMDGDKFSSADLGYHSVLSDWGYGKGYTGSEAIVYNQNQCACRYLVEIKR